MLGGMALKWRWRDRQKAAGKPTDKPNMVMGSNVQVVASGEVLPLLGRRGTPRADGGRPLPPERRRERSSDATRTPSAWCPCSAPRSTAATSPSPTSAPPSTSSRPRPASTCRCTSTQHGWVHRTVPRPRHLLGLPPSGCSRSTPRATSTASCTPASAGSSGATRMRSRTTWCSTSTTWVATCPGPLTLNFSRPGNQIAAQYYNFLRLGFDGYRRVQQSSRDVAMFLADAVGKMDHFDLITDGSGQLPVFAILAGVRHRELHRVRPLRASPGPRLADPRLQLPGEPPRPRRTAASYGNGFSRDLADLLVADLQRHTAYFDQLKTPLPGAHKSSFSH